MKNIIISKKNLFINYSALTTTMLKGFGQIMLQENALTGFLFIVGIFYGFPTMGFMAILASLCGIITSKIFSYGEVESNKGLYVFNAALVGAAIALFFKPMLMSWIIVIIGSLLATIIQQFFIIRRIPVFTLPFVLVTWLIFYIAQHYFPDLVSGTSVLVVSAGDSFTFAVRGFGQVIFQENLISGAIFFMAVFVSSPISALYGLAGAVLSAILANQFSLPTESIALGLFSYNAVLCAIVFAGNLLKDGIWVLISILLSLAISLIMMKFEVIQLTFPFVLSSCVTLLLKNSFQNQP